MLVFLVFKVLSIFAVFQPVFSQCRMNSTEGPNLYLRVNQVISSNDPKLLRKLSESVTLDKTEGVVLLRRSVMRGWVNSVSWLVKQGVDPNVKDVNGSSALHIAARLDCAQCIDAIMNCPAGVDLESRNTRDMTPLWLAAELDKLNAVKALAAYGADLNVFGRGRTPTTHAAWRGQHQTVEVLLSVGADPNIPNQYSNSALGNAAELNFLEVVKVLLKYGADTKYRNKDGRTAYHCAQIRGFKHIVNEIKRWE